MRVFYQKVKVLSPPSSGKSTSNYRKGGDTLSRARDITLMQDKISPTKDAVIHAQICKSGSSEDIDDLQVMI